MNIFTFLGWKWNLIIFFFLLIAGLCYRYPWWKLIEAQWQRHKLIEFAEGVHMAVISADVGQGKTLLLSILARHLPRGIKKLGFVSNIPDAELISYNDINFDEPIPEMDNYRIPKYYFLDETNFYIDGVNFTKNRLYHQGVAWLLQISRHHQMHLWISATRENHVWVAIRQIVNYYVKLGGVEPLMNWGKFSFYTLRVLFYKQSGELYKDFNILVSNLDFNLYDSYWLKDTSYFRPTLENIKEKEELEKKLKTESENNLTNSQEIKTKFTEKEKKPKKVVEKEFPKAEEEKEEETISKPNLIQNKVKFPSEKNKNTKQKKRTSSPLKDYLSNLKDKES